MDTGRTTRKFPGMTTKELKAAVAEGGHVNHDAMVAEIARREAPVDFDFYFDGFFIRILPNTPAAVEAWNQIAAHFEAGAIEVSAWASVKSQLEAAGFKTQQKAPGADKISTDDLLAALNA